MIWPHTTYIPYNYLSLGVAKKTRPVVCDFYDRIEIMLEKGFKIGKSEMIVIVKDFELTLAMRLFRMLLPIYKNIVLDIAPFIHRAVFVHELLINKYIDPMVIKWNIIEYNRIKEFGYVKDAIRKKYIEDRQTVSTKYNSGFCVANYVSLGLVPAGFTIERFTDIQLLTTNHSDKWFIWKNSYMPINLLVIKKLLNAGWLFNLREFYVRGNFTGGWARDYIITDIAIDNRISYLLFDLFEGDMLRTYMHNVAKHRKCTVGHVYSIYKRDREDDPVKYAIWRELLKN